MGLAKGFRVDRNRLVFSRTLRVMNSQVDPELARAAVEAVSKWRYSPTVLNGEAIEVDTTIMVNFKLLS